jgi:hypothetical protein
LSRKENRPPVTPEMLNHRRDLPLDAEDPDADRLLPGEAPTSANVEEAVHWAAVYSELTEFLHSEAQHFAPALAERYQRRLTFWLRRLEELNE